MVLFLPQIDEFEKKEMIGDDVENVPHYPFDFFYEKSKSQHASSDVDRGVHEIEPKTSDSQQRQQNNSSVIETS